MWLCYYDNNTPPPSRWLWHSQSREFKIAPGQSPTQCWPKQLEYLCTKLQEVEGATHWSRIQDLQMMLDDAAPTKLAQVMCSVTAMHWGFSVMEVKRLHMKSWPVRSLVVDVVCSVASACLKAMITEAKKSRGRQVWTTSPMQHRLQKKEELFGWHLLSK